MVDRKLWRFVIICSGLFTCELSIVHTCTYCCFFCEYTNMCFQFLIIISYQYCHHSYELVPTSSQKNNNNIDQTYDDDDDHDDSTTNQKHAKNTCSQFTLRRMACFGSPKYDRKEPLHILSADSRFPDVDPKRIRRVGNHFLALFPVTTSGNPISGGLNQFRKHALIRGGSRVVVPPRTTRVANNNIMKEENPKKATSKWGGGQGKWSKNNNEVDKQ